VTDDAPQRPPQSPPPETQKIAAEDLAQMLAASAMPGVVPDDPADKRSLRGKLFVAVLIAAVGIGASIMSCVGQSFSYRQAHALEGIEQQLKEIRAGCSVAPSPAR
jgi:hypothetical protein